MEETQKKKKLKQLLFVSRKIEFVVSTDCTIDRCSTLSTIKILHISCFNIYKNQANNNIMKTIVGYDENQYASNLIYIMTMIFLTFKFKHSYILKVTALVTTLTFRWLTFIFYILRTTNSSRSFARFTLTS